MKLTDASRLTIFLVIPLLFCAGEGRKRSFASKGNDRCLHNNGGCVHTCSNTPGNFTCACRDGFLIAPDGKDCLDKNECLENKVGCSHQCINTIGSYECTCSSGYSLDPSGKRCVFGEWCRAKFGCDHGCRPASSGNRAECYCRTGFILHSDGRTCVRSCSLGNGGCHHTCNTTTDGPVCSCADGYIFSPDNRTCTASCSISNGGCEKKCGDSNLGPVCSCPAGFQLHQDGKSCIDVDECETKTDGCSHLCENVKGGFECACPTGYKISADQKTCVDTDECLLNSTCDHTCVNLPGTFQCQCNAGYQLFGVTHCADVNECGIRNGGCQHSCTNTEGSYVCMCGLGFKLHPNRHDCIDAGQCISLVQQPLSALACVQVGSQDQLCTMTCDPQAQLTNQHGLINSTSMSFSCGPKTNYEWTNMDTGTLPQCSGSISAPSYSRKARLVFIGDSCDMEAQEAEYMKQNLTLIFNSDKKYMCKNRCQVNFVDLMCGSRRKKFRKLVQLNKKSLVTAEFELQMSSLQQPAGSCDILCTAKRNLQIFHRMFQKFKKAVRHKKYSIRFGNQEFLPVKKSLKLDQNIKEICREGMQLVNSTCIACSLGTFYSSKTKKCQLCLRGTFQDEEGQLSCKECPNRLPGSGVEGSSTQSQCNEMCEPGSVSTSGQKPCKTCQIGTFQPNFGRTSCLSCGAGLRTNGSGSTGFEVCLSRVCEPGHFYNTSTHSCSLCTKGFYQPEAGQDLCLPCPGRTLTDFEGSVFPEECKDRHCGRRIGNFFGVLESPNYPGNYPINIECIWKIHPEKRRKILIILPTIELGDEEGCGDIIIMRKSQASYSHSTFKTCESRDRPIAFTARSKKLWIQFKSNGNHTARGFSIPFVTYNEEYESLIEDIVKDGRLYSSRQHQQIFKDRQLLTALLEVIATPYNYLKYANISHTMFPPSFFKLLTPKVRRFFQT